MSERLSNALRGLSSGLSDVIGYKASQEMERAREMRETNLENLRHRNNIATLDKGAELEKTARESERTFLSGRDTARFTHETGRDKALSGYEIAAIRERGTQDRSTAFTAAYSGGAAPMSREDRLKLVQRWTDTINDFKKSVHKNEFLGDEAAQQSEMQRFIHQATIESGFDPEVVRNVSLAAGESAKAADARAQAVAAMRQSGQPAAQPGLRPASPGAGVIAQEESDKAMEQLLYPAPPSSINRARGIASAPPASAPPASAPVAAQSADLFPAAPRNQDYLGLDDARRVLDWLTPTPPTNLPPGGFSPIGQRAVRRPGDSVPILPEIQVAGDG